MGVRESLMGLLLDEPKHGYQLKVEFEAATGEAWPLNIGQVYTTLQRLERDGLADLATTDGEGRNIYAITPAGRAEVEAWFDEAVERSVEHRDDLSMKVLIAMVTGGIDPVRVIARQRSATMRTLQDYTQLKAQTDPDEVAWLLHLDRLLLQADAELRWLDRVEDRLGRPPQSTTRRITAQQPVDELTSGGNE